MGGLEQEFESEPAAHTVLGQGDQSNVAGQDLFIRPVQELLML